MSIKEKFTSQFGRPRGLGGRVAGWIMSVSNNSLSDWTFEKVSAQGSDYILEVGYGPGVTFGKIAKEIDEGLLIGIDHSELMYRIASKRNKKYCEDNKAILDYGTIDDIIYPKEFFDTIYGNNVHFFWKRPAGEFKKLFSYLKPGGKLLMIFQPRWARTLGELDRLAAEARVQFLQAGFAQVTIDFRQMNAAMAIAVTGYKDFQQ